MGTGVNVGPSSGDFLVGVDWGVAVCMGVGAGVSVDVGPGDGVGVKPAKTSIVGINIKLLINTIPNNTTPQRP